MNRFFPNGMMNCLRLQVIISPALTDSPRYAILPLQRSSRALEKGTLAPRVFGVTNMSKAELPSYLNDHLAGSVSALELLDHLIESYKGKPLEEFFQNLRNEIDTDQERRFKV